jgi:hypothetical protein
LPDKIKAVPVSLIRYGIGCNERIDCNKQMQKSDRKEKTGTETTLL